MLNKFMERINSSRTQAGYKPYTVGYFLKALDGMTPHDMHVLYQECDKAKSFGGLFTWKIKNRGK